MKEEGSNKGMTNLRGKFVVVTTDSKNRGVFAGILVAGGIQEEWVELERAQMAYRWPNSTVRGLLGLASHGPQEGSQITAPAPRILVNFVTSITETTPEAQAAWETCPWS